MTKNNTCLFDAAIFPAFWETFFIRKNELNVKAFSHTLSFLAFFTFSVCGGSRVTLEISLKWELLFALPLCRLFATTQRIAFGLVYKQNDDVNKLSQPNAGSPFSD